MALDQHERLALHQGLVDGVGRPTADRLMDALPFEWEQFATKHDLHALEERIDHKLETKIRGLLVTLFFAMFGMVLTVSSLTLAIVTVAG